MNTNFGAARRRKRRGKKAPAHCRRKLSSCMRGRASKSKSSRCMKAFARCRKRG